MSTLKLDEIKSLQGTGNTVITFNSSDKAVFASPPVVPMPCFYSALSAEQTGITNNTVTLLQMQTTVGDGFDTNGWFDNDNYRYTPQIAGYYQFSGGAWGVTNTYSTESRIIIYLYKNGGSVGGTLGYATFWSNANATATGSKLVYLNGSTDYVELRASVTASGSISVITSGSQFSGFLVRAV